LFVSHVPFVDILVTSYLTL